MRTERWGPVVKKKAGYPTYQKRELVRVITDGPCASRDNSRAGQGLVGTRCGEKNFRRFPIKRAEDGTLSLQAKGGTVKLKSKIKKNHSQKERW